MTQAKTDGMHELVEGDVRVENRTGRRGKLVAMKGTDALVAFDDGTMGYVSEEHLRRVVEKGAKK